MRYSLAAVVLVTLAFTTSASAAPAVLTSVGLDGLHPTANWTLPPGGQTNIIEVATSPAVGSNGEFFRENVVLADNPTPVTSTSWKSTSALLPGQYYVEVDDTDTPCFYAGLCPIEEFSNILPLTIRNERPRLSGLRGRVVGDATYAYLVASVRVCDREQVADDAKPVTLLIQQRRLRRGKVVAAKRNRDAVIAFTPCTREQLVLTLPGARIRRGETYRLDVQARDQFGALSNWVVLRKRR